MIRSENTCALCRSENRHMHKYTAFHRFIENKPTRKPFYMEITHTCAALRDNKETSKTL